jgi:DNA helicase TIP49 (TBP-interacting protein)
MEKDVADIVSANEVTGGSEPTIVRRRRRMSLSYAKESVAEVTDELRKRVANSPHMQAIVNGAMRLQPAVEFIQRVSDLSLHFVRFLSRSHS